MRSQAWGHLVILGRMVIRRMVSSVVQRQVKYVTPVMPSAASGLVAQVYAEVAREMRIVIPPALLHSPKPELLAAYWMLVREPLLPIGSVGRDVKEAVATAVSVANICPYCVEMHSVGMYDLAGEHDAESLAADRIDEVSEPLRELVAWGRRAHQPDHMIDFPPGSRAELVGVVVGMHYLTRMVNVFLSSFLLPPGLNPAARRRFKRGASLVLRPVLRAEHQPGRSLLLPATPLPPDAAWAEERPAIAAAMARSGRAFDDAGEEHLSSRVREIVLSRLESWRGEEPGLNRSWCDTLVGGLSASEQSAARLALLAAFASYQVDEEAIGMFRSHFPGDVPLISVVAWASFAAARRIGSRYSNLEVSPAEQNRQA